VDGCKPLMLGSKHTPRLEFVNDLHKSEKQLAGPLATLVTDSPGHW